jgi:hypothetical protein
MRPNRFRGAEGVRVYALLLVAGALAIAGFPDRAKAQTLDNEQCGVRIPYGEIKQRLIEPINDALRRLEGGGALNVELLTLLDTYISRDGGRIRVDATFYVSVNYVLPQAFMGLSFYVKWVEDDIQRSWEECDGVQYPDFIVDAVHCYPILDLSPNFEVTAAVCGAVTARKADMKCDIQQQVQEELDPLLSERLIEGVPRARGVVARSARAGGLLHGK